MTITPIHSLATSAGATQGPTSPVATSTLQQKNLSQDDFLKLLSVQFQQQDPLQPVDDTAFIAQMAQFTSLEQQSSINTQVTALNSSQQDTAATLLLGQTVSVKKSDGTTVSGLVSSVDLSGTTPQITVNGAAYPYSSVTKVSFPTGTSSAATPVSVS